MPTQVNGVNVTVLPFLNVFNTIYVGGLEFTPGAGDPIDSKEPYTQIGTLVCDRLFVAGEEVFGTGSPIPDGLAATVLKNVNCTQKLAIGGFELSAFTPLWDGSTTPTFRQGDAVETGAFTNFAESVDMAKVTKDRVIVSNDNFNTPFADAGAAHVYRLDSGNWVLEQTLQATTPAASQFYGRYISMDGSGNRIVLQKETGAPANQEMEIWTRSGTTWTRGNTITTAFVFGTTSTQMNLSADGNVLAVRGNRGINILRWNGSNYISEFLDEQTGEASYGEAIEINQDGDFVVVTSVDSGRIWYYEDQGGGSWSVNNIGSGVAAGQVFEDSLGISNDKTTIGVCTNGIYNSWKDSGSGFVKVTNNLNTGQSMRASRMSSSGFQWTAAQTSLSQLEMYEGDTETPYTFSALYTPPDVEQATSGGKISYDGRMVLIGNQGWRLSNGQQGRFYTYEV